MKPELPENKLHYAHIPLSLVSFAHSVVGTLITRYLYQYPEREQKIYLMKEEASNILKTHQLRVTPNRLAVLTVFLAQDRAYSLADMEGLLPIDRSTIFRCLQTFSESDILERFNDATGNYIYTMAQEHHHCTEQSHLHFKCNQCHATISLPHLPAEYLAKLGNHKMETLSLLIEGTCQDCQA